MGSASTEGLITQNAINVEQDRAIAWGASTVIKETGMLVAAGEGSHNIGQRIENHGYTVISHMNAKIPGLNVRSIGNEIINSQKAFFVMCDPDASSASTYSIDASKFTNQGVFLMRGTGGPNKGDMNLNIRTTEEFNNEGLLALEQMQGPAARHISLESHNVSKNSGIIRLLNTMLRFDSLDGEGCISLLQHSKVIMTAASKQMVVFWSKTIGELVVMPSVYSSGSATIRTYGFNRDHQIRLLDKVDSLDLNGEMLTLKINSKTLTINLGFTDKYNKEGFKMQGIVVSGLAYTAITYTQDPHLDHVTSPAQCPNAVLYSNLGWPENYPKKVNDLRNYLDSLKKELP